MNSLWSKFDQHRFNLTNPNFKENKVELGWT